MSTWMISSRLLNLFLPFSYKTVYARFFYVQIKNRVYCHFRIKIELQMGKAPSEASVAYYVACQLTLQNIISGVFFTWTIFLLAFIECLVSVWNINHFNLGVQLEPIWIFTSHSIHCRILKTAVNIYRNKILCLIHL